MAEVVERYGTVDVLVNNAGVGHAVAVEDEDVDTFRRTMEINVTAVWHLCKEVGVPMVAQRSGSIVNVASMLGFVGSTPIKQAHYVASKGAVVTLTKELALQWARKGVRVNAPLPRLVPERDDGGDGERRGSQRFITTNSPMPRMGEADELDGPLLLLASRAGSFMTGHSLVVDGGWLAR